MMDRSRILSVDILRGIFAVGVMLYHYSYWLPLHVQQPYLLLLHKIGIYAVEGFFVLSGFSLYWAYRTRPPTNVKSYSIYIATRMLRLAPLYVLAMLLNNDISLTSVEVSRMLANVTLTLGFINPSLSMIVGGWSIGVEMVFSVLLPVLIVIQIRLKHLFAAIVVASFIPLYFWQGEAAYVQAPNHMIFFIAGIYLGFWREHGFILSPLSFWSAILVGIFAFTIVGANQIGMATILEGWGRLTLTCITIIICGLFCLYDFKKVPIVFAALTFLGEASYSIYLLHPIVFQRRAMLGPVSAAQAYFLLSIATVFVAYVTFNLFEKQLLRLKPKHSVKSSG